MDMDMDMFRVIHIYTLNMNVSMCIYVYGASTRCFHGRTCGAGASAVCGCAARTPPCLRTGGSRLEMGRGFGSGRATAMRAGVGRCAAGTAGSRLDLGRLDTGRGAPFPPEDLLAVLQS